jgi:hypothetical protein
VGSGDSVLPALLKGGNMECIWTQDDEDSNTYSTDCGECFEITDGTPKDNGFKFCFYCGKQIKQELYSKETP